MTYPACGHPVHATGGVCPLCGAFVQEPGTELPGDSFSSPNVAHPVRKPSPIASVLYVTLSISCWLLIFAANYVIALRWSGRFDSETRGYMFGGCLAAFLFSSLVVWLYYRKKPARPSSLKMVFLVSLWAAVFTIPNFIGSKQDSVENRDARVTERMAVLMKEAAGEAPSSPLKEEWEGSARDFCKDLIEENRRYQRETDALEVADLADLYSPGSYTSSARTAKMIGELRAMQDVETKHYQSLGTIFERYKNRFRALNISEEEKEAYVRGVEQGLAKNSDYEGLYAKEKDWLQQSIELYNFALRNKKSFRLTNNEISSRSAEFLNSFQSMQSRAISLRDDLLAAQAQFESKRRSKLEKMGLRPADVGEQERPVKPSTSQ